MTKLSSLSLAIALATFSAACASQRATDSPGIPEETVIREVRAVSMPAVRAMLATWPDKSREVGMEMTDKYGPPHETTPTMLVWHDNGPWKRTVVYRDPVPHNFPMPHQDLLEQFINYRVPPDRFDELAQYDGSVIAERTKGVLSARCDKEAANFLALNLANEIVTGQRSVEDARAKYAEQIRAMMNGQPAPYTERLLFTPPQGSVGDPDRAIM